jgi:glycosyltransferase involved in cell wall biosynthesis
MWSKDHNGKFLLLFSDNGPRGGIQASCQLAWKGLKKHGAIVSVFCYGNAEKALPVYDFDGAENIFFSSAKGNIVFKAILAFSKGPFDLILFWHLHLLKLFPLLAIFSRNKNKNIRAAVFLHGIEAWRPLPWYLRMNLSGIDLFLSNSNYTWEQFIHFNPSFRHKKHITVHLGAGKSNEVECIKAPACMPIALMLGRMIKTEDYKGHREMITAWPLVLEKIPDAQLWIGGDGDLLPELEALAGKLDIKEHVKFLRWIPEEKKQELILKSRCLALPSCGEGFGLVYLEAMRLGRPCLVSNFDAGKEVVNPPEAGLAADPGNPQQLADAVCRLLTPGQEWNRWSYNAQKRYQQNFTEDHYQKRLMQALLQMKSWEVNKKNF